MERCEISHLDLDLTHADSVSIMFEYQKRDERSDTITQHRTGDPLLCPVHQWGAIIHRIRAYPESCDHTPVNMILSSTNKKPQLITNIMLLNKLRSAATAVGKDV